MNEEGVGYLLPLHVTPSASRHGGEGVAILLPLTALVPRHGAPSASRHAGEGVAILLPITALVPRHGAPGSAVRREGVIILFPLPLRCQAMCQ